MRCILTIAQPGTEIASHILVFIVSEANKLYHVVSFPEDLQEQLDEDLDVKRLANVNYDTEISLALNAAEKKIGNNAALVSMMVNGDFDSSYIIFATNA